LSAVCCVAVVSCVLRGCCQLCVAWLLSAVCCVALVSCVLRGCCQLCVAWLLSAVCCVAVVSCSCSAVRYIVQQLFDVFLTVHHSIDFFQVTNLMHNSFIL